MMRYISLAPLILILQIGANSQSNWVEVPLPIVNSNLFTISFADSVHGCIAGRDGILLYTSDNGMNWSVDSIPTPFEVAKCRMISENVAWAFAFVLAGENAIFRTTNRGISWSGMTLPDTLPVLGATFLSEHTAYAMNATHCWKTTDGGDTWHQRGRFLGWFPPYPTSFRSIGFIDDVVGFIDGFIQPVGSTTPQMTTDGGLTWSGYWMSSCPFFSAEFAWAKPIQFVAGGLCTFIYGSRDFMGAPCDQLVLSWNNMQDTAIIRLPLFPFEPKGFALDQQNMWYIVNSIVRRTTNGGTAWIIETLPVETIELLVDRTGHRLALGGGRLFRFVGSPNSAGMSGTLPYDIELHQNFPNPFNPTTTIRFELPVSSFVSLKVYDVLGREMATLVNEVKEPGEHSVQFDGSNLSSGVYFYRLQTPTMMSTKRMVLIK